MKTLKTTNIIKITGFLLSLLLSNFVIAAAAGLGFVSFSNLTPGQQHQITIKVFETTGSSIAAGENVGINVNLSGLKLNANEIIEYGKLVIDNIATSGNLTDYFTVAYTTGEYPVVRFEQKDLEYPGGGEATVIIPVVPTASDISYTVVADKQGRDTFVSTASGTDNFSGSPGTLTYSIDAPLKRSATYRRIIKAPGAGTFFLTTEAIGVAPNELPESLSCDIRSATTATPSVTIVSADTCEFAIDPTVVGTVIVGLKYPANERVGEIYAINVEHPIPPAPFGMINNIRIKLIQDIDRDLRAEMTKDTGTGGFSSPSSYSLRDTGGGVHSPAYDFSVFTDEAWTSSDSSIVSITNLGVATGNATGPATITFTARRNGNIVTVPFGVTVVARPDAPTEADAGCSSADTTAVCEAKVASLQKILNCVASSCQYGLLTQADFEELSTVIGLTASRSSVKDKERYPGTVRPYNNYDYLGAYLSTKSIDEIDTTAKIEALINSEFDVPNYDPEFYTLDGIAEDNEKFANSYLLPDNTIQLYAKIPYGDGYSPGFFMLSVSRSSQYHIVFDQNAIEVQGRINGILNNGEDRVQTVNNPEWRYYGNDADDDVWVWVGGDLSYGRTKLYPSTITGQGNTFLGMKAVIKTESSIPVAINVQCCSNYSKSTGSNVTATSRPTP